MKNRLLIELETLRKSINREVINPQLPELALDDLRPLLALVARARADYVGELLALGTRDPGTPLDIEAVEALRNRRLVFQELVDAVNALETVIQREYLDVKSSRKS